MKLVVSLLIAMDGHALLVVSFVVFSCSLLWQSFFVQCTRLLWLTKAVTCGLLKWIYLLLS